MNTKPHMNDQDDAIPVQSYLWDREGPADPHVADLEQALSPFGFAESRLRSPIVSNRRTGPTLAAFAAALLLLAGLSWMMVSKTHVTESSSWAVSSLAGTPAVNAKPISRDARLAVGQVLETDADAQAVVDVADIGHVTVKPQSRVTLINTGRDQHRLALERGEIHALIYAPPKLFLVETKAATAVDYGCEYTLQVDEFGNGTLEVLRGLVKLERGGRDVSVPANVVCRMRAGIGPGTPRSRNASGTLAAALDRFDFEGRRANALQAVLDAATVLDSITLWHLLLSTTGSERGLVFDRLAGLVTPPPSVTRDGILKSDQGMLDQWEAIVRRNW